jgi:glycosyltransferase involved in cell wall biosynthesis
MIAVVMPLAERKGGAEVALLDLLREREPHNERVAVLFLEDGPMVTETVEMGHQAYVIPAGRLRHPHHFAASVVRIARVLRKVEASVVVSWMTKAHLYSAPAARIAGIPAVWFQLGLPRTSDALDRIATALPTRGVICCSAAVAAAQRQLRPRHPTEVVHLGTRLDRFDPERLPSPAALRQELGLPPDGPLIGIFGRLQRWKGFHVLLAALPSVLSREPLAHCVLVGGEHDLEPGYLDDLLTLTDELGIGERVVFAGFQDDVPRWMQACDVVVHASDEEPLGLVVLEAMALGKPVVAGSAGGPAEVVTPGEDGLLAPYGEPEALASALLRLLGDPEFATRLGAAGRRRAQEFSTAVYARRFDEALMRLARPGPRPQAAV